MKSQIMKKNYVKNMDDSIEKLISDNIKYDDQSARNSNKIEFYNYLIPKLISKNKPIHVIETGTMYNEIQGAFTKIIGHIIKNYTGGKLFTVDISEDHINKSKEYTSEYSDFIESINFFK